MIAVLAVVAGVSFGLLSYFLLFNREPKTLYAGLRGEGGEPRYRRFSRGWFEGWADRFNRTGGQSTPRGPGLIMLVVPLFFGVAAALLSGLLAALPVITVLSVVLPWIFLKGQGDKRAAAMDRQLVPFLDAVSKGLEGGTLLQAIREASDRVEPPLSQELQLLLNDVDAGVPLSDALQAMAERNSSRGMTVTCSTLDLAIATGAPTLQTNLAEITNVLVAYQGLEKQVQSRTTISRWTGRIALVVVSAMTVGSLVIATEAWITPLGALGLAIIIGSLLAARKAFAAIGRSIMAVNP